MSDDAVEPPMSRFTGPLDPETRARVVARFERIRLMKTLEFRMHRLEPGECDLLLENRRDLDGIFESLHGGILATLADSAIAFAGLTLIDPDEIITTIEFNIRFLAPCRESVLARSRVLKAGRSLITGQVDLVGQDTRTTFAWCGVTYMRLRRYGEGIPAQPTARSRTR